MEKIWLQSYGYCLAIPIEDLKPGMITVWNYGEERKISGIKTSKSGKTHQIVYDDGSIDHRKMRTGRLVAISE